KYKNNYKLNEENREREYLLKSWNRKVEKIIDFQFNSGLGINFCSNGVITKKNKNNDKIHIFDKKQKDLIGIFKIELGQIFLTLKGALKLRPFIKNSNIIVFNGDKIKGNTLFRPGIIEFSPNLFPNSHVIILDQEKQKVIGVGEMIVGSKYIKNSKTGRIVRVYERIK
ncbi:MAG: PUA domain-containing protein, partial [Promethearchaeota archaeon]